MHLSAPSPPTHHMDFCNKNAVYAKQKAEQAYSQFEIQRDRLQICSCILYKINLPPVFPTERTYSSAIRPFLLFKFLKPLCREQVDEPFNVTSAAVHLQLWTNVQAVKQAGHCCSPQKLAIFNPHHHFVDPKWQSQQVWTMNFRLHTCLYALAHINPPAPLPVHIGLVQSPVEADGWVKPSLPGQIKMSPRAMLSAEPPICSSATELRWMKPRSGRVSDREQVVDPCEKGQISHCPDTGRQGLNSRLSILKQGEKGRI